MRYTDEVYPANIARCQHIKVNGTLCGSPALKHKRLCFFHHQWQQNRIQLNANQARRGGAPLAIDFPILEDANSIQVALMQVMRLLFSGGIEHRTAALLLYALQTASSNLSRTEFKPHPEEVVIDPNTVAETLLGDKAWYKQEFVDLQNQEDEDHQTEEVTEEENQEDGTIHAVACPSDRRGQECPRHPGRNARATRPSGGSRTGVSAPHARLNYAPDSANTSAAFRVRGQRDLHAGQRDELRRGGLDHPAEDAFGNGAGNLRRPADFARDADAALHRRPD
jgi:hypothetical protein